MKILLKYLIFTTIVFAFIGGTDKSNSANCENLVCDLSVEFIYDYTDFSIFDSALHNSRQVSPTNIIYSNTPLQRVNNTHKHNFTFIKAGKILNTGIINSFQNNSLIFYSSRIKSVRRLISFGKLII